MFIDSLKKEYFYNSVVLLLGVIVFNLANIIFYFIAARLYSLEIYAELLTLMSLYSVFAMASGAIILLATDKFSRLNLKNNAPLLDREINSYNFYIFILSFVVLFLLSICAKFFTTSLYIDNYFLYFLVVFSVFLVFPLSLYRGFLQGIKKFDLLSMVLMVEGLLKIILLLFALFFSLPTTYYLFSLFLSSFLVFLFLIWKLKIKFSSRAKFLVHKISRQSIYLVISFSILSFYLNIDLIIFRHFLPLESGFYGLSALCAKLLFYFSAAFVGVLYPLVVDNSKNKTVHKNLLFGTFLLILILFLFIFIVYYFWGFDLLKTFIPNIPVIYWGYLLKLTFAFFLFALTNAFVNYFLALKDRLFLPLLVFIFFLQVILLISGANSVEGFISRLLTASIVACIVFAVRFIFFLKKS